VIAHNLSYDRDMLNIEFQRLGHFIAWPPGLCTVEQSVHYKGYRLNLTGLHEYLFGQPFAGAHRARPDVEALTRCCVEMFKRRDL
jgi:DNA polymerase III epsilon subunit-like protein